MTRLLCRLGPVIKTFRAFLTDITGLGVTVGGAVHSEATSALLVACVWSMSDCRELGCDCGELGCEENVPPSGDCGELGCDCGELGCDCGELGCDSEVPGM